MIGSDITGFDYAAIVKPVAMCRNGVSRFQATIAALRQRTAGLQVNIFAGDIAQVIDFTAIQCTILIKRLTGGIAGGRTWCRY